jgi:hypothetical protein
VSSKQVRGFGREELSGQGRGEEEETLGEGSGRMKECFYTYCSGRPIEVAGDGTKLNPA